MYYIALELVIFIFIQKSGSIWAAVHLVKVSRESTRSELNTVCQGDSAIV